MVAHVDNFHLMMIIVVASLPLLLLLRQPPLAAGPGEFGAAAQTRKAD